MDRVVEIERDGAAAARQALERCVLSGGIALFPADGLYGLACDPLRADAIARIHELKGRDEGKPSAVMFFSPLAMRELVSSLRPRARDAVGTLLPGPFTLVVDNPERRYPLACREDERRLGVRLIDGPLAGASCPVLQTSANRAGQSAPGRFADVPEDIRERADLAIDGGELTGRPSTVVDITGIESGADPVVLREGAVPAAEVADLVARVAAAYGWS
ncbi:MAG TPA: Sua5/YciO/YrdC/YwlC family protein [Solirubrobacterales bacterium]|nr:Sua5/YciO/YrdC/YwlC family protein [Solirubrobacterales bacterium]